MPQIGERKNVLITGGAGFIGSHLCDALVKTAHVICMDNLSTGAVANIEHLLQNSNFEFINHDITEPFQLSDFPELERFHIKLQGVQEIYHLASPISKKQFEDYRIATVLTNSLGTKHVLDVAVAHRAKVLYASSSALYGPRRKDHLFVSEADPCVLDHLTPTGSYDEGKRFSEAILYTYGDVHKLDVKIARLFRTYGPRMKIFDGNLIPDMVNAALEDRDIELNCSEEQTFSLCYISDMVDGLIRHMQSPMEITVVNFGSDQEYRYREVAEMIVALVGSPSRVQCELKDPLSREAGVPDIGRARQALHWLPLVRLEDGLKKMIQDAQSRRHLQRAF